MEVEQQVGLDAPPANSPRRILAVTCGNHAAHDGYTDTLYLLLPLWQAEFGLSYGAVGVMRALYSAVLAAFQVPAASLAVRFSPVLLLAGGTALSGLGYMLAGASAASDACATTAASRWGGRSGQARHRAIDHAGGVPHPDGDRYR